MATSIHHGPPGSFKSFTLVQRFAIDALQEGRVVVTNIRGFNDVALVKSQFPDTVFPESANIIYLNGETAVGRQLIGGFFHWVPFGALILIDEGQRVYPVRRDFKLESLDKFICPDVYTPQQLPNGIARPEDIYTAFDMQRHYQWDVFISTTNIAKIQKPIREVAETAYLHKSLSGKLPFLFKNTWYEFQHDPENNGKSISQRIGTPHKYKADPRVFKCYQSTATGEHTASKADKNILSDNGVRFKLLIIILSIGSAVYFFFSSLSARQELKVDKKPDIPVATTPVQTPATSPQDSPVVRKNSVSQANDGDSNHVSDRQIDHFFTLLGYKVIAVAFQDLRDNVHKRLTFIADSPAGLKVVKFDDLASYGITVKVRGLCNVSLYHPAGPVIPITCHNPTLDQCAAYIQSAQVFSQHYCTKYPDPEASAPPVRNALVTASANLLPGNK